MGSAGAELPATNSGFELATHQSMESQMKDMRAFLAAGSLVAVLALTTGSSLAAATWRNAPKGAPEEITAFVPQLGYSKGDISALLHAKSVDVVTYGDDWTPASVDKGLAENQAEALDALTSDTGEIQQLQHALRANPAAARLIAQHQIKLTNVLGISPAPDGTVQLLVRS
jgi:hypothetical protein